jgi:FkbM family methyltransferase
MERIPTSADRGQDRALETIQTMYGTFLTVPGDPVSQRLHAYSAHQRNELAMLRSLLRPGDVVLDIGAHIGTVAIPLALACDRSVRVFAFEPQPDVFALLERNVALNGLGDQISLFAGIVSDRLQSFKTLPNHGAPPGRENTMATAFMPTSEGDEHGPAVFRIDVMIGAGTLPLRFDLVKIDTEGSELSALRSCSHLIGRELPVLYIEINAPTLRGFNTSVDDVERFLDAHGYHYFRNVAERNSETDSFRIARIQHLREGGHLFDLLAVHPRDPRYPHGHDTYNAVEAETLRLEPLLKPRPSQPNPPR